MRTLSLESSVDMLEMRGGCSWDEMEGGGRNGEGSKRGRTGPKDLSDRCAINSVQCGALHKPRGAQTSAGF